MKKLPALLFALCGGLALSACGGVTDAIDCHSICNRYKSCFDSGYDTSKCESNCRDNADKDSNYEDNVKKCNDCIDDKSCSSATFTCAASCGNVVP